MRSSFLSSLFRSNLLVVRRRGFSVDVEIENRMQIIRSSITRFLLTLKTKFPQVTSLDNLLSSLLDLQHWLGHDLSLAWLRTSPSDPFGRRRSTLALVRSPWQYVVRAKNKKSLILWPVRSINDRRRKNTTVCLIILVWNLTHRHPRVIVLNRISIINIHPCLTTFHEHQPTRHLHLPWPTPMGHLEQQRRTPRIIIVVSSNPRICKHSRKWTSVTTMTLTTTDPKETTTRKANIKLNKWPIEQQKHLSSMLIWYSIASKS